MMFRGLLWMSVVLISVADENRAFVMCSASRECPDYRPHSATLSRDMQLINNTATCHSNASASRTLSQGFESLQPKWIKWNINYRRAVSFPYELVKNAHLMLARNVPVTEAAPMITPVERHNMSLAVSGVIGALCALMVVLVAGTIIVVWRKRHYQRVCGDIERSSSSSYFTSSGHTIPSFAGTGSFLTVGRPMSSNSNPQISSLRSQTSSELERDTNVGVSPRPRSGESTVLLPDNLYMPVPVEETSPAAESSHVMCTTPGGDINESPVERAREHGLAKGDESRTI